MLLTAEAVLYIIPMALTALAYTLFVFVIRDTTTRAYVFRGVSLSTILMIWLIRYNRIRRNLK